MSIYLVTGGAGFIGSNIVGKLVELGHSVRVVDNLATGRQENIKEYLEKIDFVCGDLSDFSIAKKVVDGTDYIIHQAAIPSVPRSIIDPLATNDSIVTSTVNIFKAAVDCGSVKRIVQASSSSAYGNTKVLPKIESMNPDPLSPYAVAKLTQEYYGRAFYNVYGLEIISLRYFNVFGPKQDPKSVYSAVIPKFISCLLEGESPVIYGDGETSRDFSYIENVVEANLLACTCKWTGESEVINIGCGKRITLNQLVEYLNLILELDIKPIYKDTRVGDVKHSMADITKAVNILGYEPKVDVYSGLRKLVYYNMKLSNID